MEQRPEYDVKGEFCWDGPSDWKRWCNQLPRILFLVKEPHGGYHPCEPIKSISGPFQLNIARWKYIIRDLYEHPDQCPKELDESDIKDKSQNNNDDIAIVEVKKKNEEWKRSDMKDILGYANRDQDLLREQIDLIDPHIVLCAFTIDAYGDYIYGNDDWQLLHSITEPKKARCFKHMNRLVIDYYHVSNPSGVKLLFDALCKLIMEGKVFSNFHWMKKIC